MTIQCPITVIVTAPAPVTPTMSAACEAWIASRGIDLNAVTSDDVFAAFSAVNSGVIDYACGQAIAAAYQSLPAVPTKTYAVGFGAYNAITAQYLPANINVAGRDLTSPTNGSAIRIDLPGGTYSVIVSLAGYVTRTVNLTVSEDITMGVPLYPL